MPFTHHNATRKTRPATRSIELSPEAVSLIREMSDAAKTLTSDKDLDFMGSLIGSVQKYGALTEKQLHWARKLIEKASNPPAPRETADLGNFAPIQALFAKAGERLKAPVVLLHVEGIGEVRLSTAGASAKVPGSINVATPGGYGNNTWFGRILKDGRFEISPRASSTTALLSVLKAFAAEPAKIAAEHGRILGKCVFCRLPLKDERSLAVGYGKQCADNYGLAWGH